MKRALCLKNAEDECLPNFVNPIVPAFEEWQKELFNFNSVGWQKINAENIDDLQFPSINVTLNEENQFDDLSDNDAFWASIGPYEVKAASRYLNTRTNQHEFFEAQKLDPNSQLYEKLATKYFGDQPLNVIRLRIPSSHKSSGFHKLGYKVYLFYNIVLDFIDGDPDRFELSNYEIPDRHELHYEPNYYFKYCFPFSFCSCKSGRRTLGMCSHRMAAILFFGKTGVDFRRKIYRALDSTNYNPMQPNPEIDTDE